MEAGPAAVEVASIGEDVALLEGIRTTRAIRAWRSRVWWSGSSRTM